MTGRKKFSFSIFNDYPGALSSSVGAEPMLDAKQKDLAYTYQIGGRQPWLLGSDCFSVALVVDSKHQSNKAYEQLVKMDILSAEGEISMQPMESKNFGKTIMSRLAFLPQVKIKMIIDFLFWWVEEAQRIKRLLGEQQDLKEAIRTLEAAGEEIPQDISIGLQQTEARLASLPSRRDSNVENAPFIPAGSNHNATDSQMHDLPPYESVRNAE